MHPKKVPYFIWHCFYETNTLTDTAEQLVRGLLVAGTGGAIETPDPATG